MRLEFLALGLALAFQGGPALAGPLLSATLDQTFRVGTADTNTLSVHVSAVNPSGLLAGSGFSLDAGNAFATTITQPLVNAPLTRVTIVIGGNGVLAGTLGASTLAPAFGISGYERLRAKVGRTPAFTLIEVPHSVGAGIDVRAIPPGSTPLSPSLAISQFGDVWHLGVVTQTGLTGGPLPDARATGHVSVTPSGNTHVVLVSLSRIRVRGLANFTTTALARLTLIYAPEPGLAVLLGAAGAALFCAGLRRRPAAS